MKKTRAANRGSGPARLPADASPRETGGDFAIDILLVAYNSEKWLDGCVASIAASGYDLSRVTLCFWDNASTDGTAAALERLKARYGARFGGFEIGRGEKNLGFGCGNNAAAELGRAPYLFCLNTDTELYPDTLEQIEREICASGEDTGVWELRQFPYEHPKFYDPVTRETVWCSGACFVIRRALFERLGGFDRRLFMYGEDVDLSWRVRAEGYAVRFVPKAVVRHYCYQSAGEVKPGQYVYSIVNHLYLRHKFGGLRTVWRGYAQFAALMRRHGPFPHARSQMCAAFLRSLPAYASAVAWHARHIDRVRGKYFPFRGWDYEFIRDGAFYENERPKGEKKVSVLVRTCGRPQVLRETLISLRNQTYPNLEIVVVEDGPDTARKMIEREFADLPIVYEATGRKMGRSAAGNRALALATGDYLNFLDDDDVFFADHVETLVMELQRHPQMQIAYAYGFDTPVRVLSVDPYRYEIQGYYGHVKFDFNRLELLHHNLFPIQAVMFSRAVYEELGGLDERMDALEDWDLWVRYASRYAFWQVKKTTSVYRVPADREADGRRQKALDDALAAARHKQAAYVAIWNAEELLADYMQGLALHAAAPALPVGLARRVKAKVKALLGR